MAKNQMQGEEHMVRPTFVAVSRQALLRASLTPFAGLNCEEMQQ